MCRTSVPAVLAAAMLILVLGASCTTMEHTVVIRLTNSQNESVAFGGYYKVRSTGDSVTMSGSTPGEYEIVCKGEDNISGRIWKGPGELNLKDIHISILVNGEEELKGDIVLPGEDNGAQFSIEIRRR